MIRHVSFVATRPIGPTTTSFSHEDDVDADAPQYSVAVVNDDTAAAACAVVVAAAANEVAVVVPVGASCAMARAAAALRHPEDHQVSPGHGRE